MAKKTYIAIYDNVAHEFHNWGECKSFVDDKKGVKFQGFENLEDAQLYINRNIKKQIDLHTKDVFYLFPVSIQRRESDRNGVAQVQHYYGYSLVRNGMVVYKDTGIACDVEISNKHKVIADLKGVIMGARMALNKFNTKRVVVVTGFSGLEMWANKSWKVKDNNIFTQEYVDDYDELSRSMIIDFYNLKDEEKVEVEEFIKAARTKK